jgi:hypothetical protein
VAGCLDDENRPPFGTPAAVEAGVLDKRCLLQSRIWVDARGRTWLIDSMTDDYRNNVLGFLRANGADWVIQAHAWILVDLYTAAIDRVEATRRMALLRALPTNWTDHTVLGERLREQRQPP